MKSGTTVRLPVHINNLPDKDILTVIFTLTSGKGIVQKAFVSNPNDGLYFIDLTQEDTTKLQGHMRIEAQINYSDLSVQKTLIGNKYISDTLGTMIVPNNAPTDDSTSIELQLDI